MSLLPRTRPKPTAETLEPIDVPDLRADPRYIAAASLLAEFRARHERLEQERIRLAIEHQLRGKAPDEKSPADAQLRDRLAVLQALPPLPVAAAPGAAHAGDRIAKGKAILNGETVAAPADHSGKMAEIDRQLEAIREAIFEQSEVVNEIVGQITLEIATDLKPQWDALQLQWYRSAQEFARVTAQVHDLRARIVAAGILSRSDVLAMPAVRSPLILGSETSYDSEISHWRRILETLGILR